MKKRYILLIVLVMLTFIINDTLKASEVLDEFHIERNPFSFFIQGGDSFMYPGYLLSTENMVLNVECDLKDVLRERKDDGTFNYIRDIAFDSCVAKAFEYMDRKSVITIGYRSGIMEGELPSENLSGLEMTVSGFAFGFSTAFGRHNLGISYLSRSRMLFFGYSMEEFPSSDIADENQYLYDPLEEYFGTDYNLTGTGNKGIVVAEDLIYLTDKSSLDIRFSSFFEEYLLSVEYTDSDSETGFVDIPVETAINRGDISYYYKHNNKWNVKLLLSGLLEEINYNIDPRHVDPANDIVKYGEGDINLEAVTVGGGVLYNIDDKTSVHSKLKRENVFGRMLSEFTTPVLGMIGPIPVFHKIVSTATARMPFNTLQVGYSKKLSDKLLLDIIPGWVFSSSALDAEGIAKLSAGLDNIDINSEIQVSMGLIFLNANLKYAITDYLILKYRFFLNIPYYKISGGSVPVEANDRLRGGGGMEHLFGISLYF